MPEVQQITKAEIREITWTADGEPEEVPEGSGGKRLQVQFNPQSLKITYANQKAGGDQRGGGAIQFVGTGSTKLSLDALFDVTAPLPDGSFQPEGDVRYLTKDVAYFITPVRSDQTAEDGSELYVPPGVRFIWGSFIFDGVMDSLNETLEFFSNEGKPLRATVAVALSRQDVYFEIRSGGGSGIATPPVEAQQGDTLQGIAAQIGQAADWQDLAAANDIENPRIISAGTVLDVSL